MAVRIPRTESTSEFNSGTGTDKSQWSVITLFESDYRLLRVAHTLYAKKVYKVEDLSKLSEFELFAMVGATEPVRARIKQLLVKYKVPLA